MASSIRHEPRFKVGDLVRHRCRSYLYQINEIKKSGEHDLNEGEWEYFLVSVRDQPADYDERFDPFPPHWAHEDALRPARDGAWDREDV